MSAFQGRTNAFVVALIVAAGLFVRILYVNNTIIDTPIVRDAAQYVAYAHNLAFNGVYSQSPPGNNPRPDSYRSPGYPMMIAVVLRIAGIKGFYGPLLYLQCILGGLVVLLIFVLSRNVLPPNWSLAATGLTVLSPHLISMSSYILTETLVSFLLLCALVAYVKALETQSRLLFVSAAVFFGLCYLANEIALLIPLVLSVVSLSFIKDPKTGKKALNLMIFLLVFVMFPAAWNVRNAINVPSDGKSNFHRALSAAAQGSYPKYVYKDPRFVGFPYREDPYFPEMLASVSRFAEIVLDRAKERPGRYVSWYVIEKPYYLWSWNIVQGQDIYIYSVRTSLFHVSPVADLIKKIFRITHPAIVILMAMAIFLAATRLIRGDSRIHRDIVIYSTTAIIVYWTVAHALLLSLPRYGIPLRPLTYFLAVWVLYESIHSFRSQKQPLAYSPKVD